MAASNNNNAHKPELTLPTSIAQTMRLVQRVAHSATWGEHIARHHQPPPAADFGPRLFRRFDAANAPGQWADAFAQRFVADELPPSSSALPLAPHAPAQRQVSAARQGALTWSGGDAFSSPASSSFGGPIDRFADASQSLIGDLMGSGWGVQSARTDTLRRFAEPANTAQAPAGPTPIHRSPAPTAAPAAPAQTLAPINRQADAPAALESTDSEADSSSTTDSTAASDATPPIETASTRPMTLFRGTPQSPLMRMGLSESSSGNDAPAAPATINRQPASGELPVVRPARGSDEPSFAAPAPTSAAINRRAEQPPTTDIQRSASDQPVAAAQPEATSSDSAQPEVQRQATTESSSPAADSTIDRSAETQVAQAPVQRSEAPTSSANAGSAEVPAAPASVEPAPAASGPTQSASVWGADVIARSTSDATPTVQRTAADADAAENTTPTGSAPAQRSPVTHRQPVQPARAASIDTVLPLATRLLQRYSAGSSQGTSGSMPLLRTFAPTTAAVMRSAAPVMSSTASVQTSGNSSAPGASAAGSTSLPPLVHRSPIVPMLPTATLQREPATGRTVAAAPALEWSALPLLQRVSNTHALPATPAASSPTASVAAQVINCLALDQPGAAPMPLLRMHAPSIAPTADAPAATTLMRAPGEAAADSTPDTTAGQSATNDATGSQGAGLGAQPAEASTGFGVTATPAIHRSAILPSLTSAAFQPLTLLRVHTPDAPGMAQADLAPGRSQLQRSPAASGSPIMLRAAAPPSLSSPVSASGEQAGSEPTSLSSPSLSPLVHRSPIVPLLPTTTVQREPATGGRVSAATPALEWSALPLLQRLSGTHALPATPAASSPTASVAAQVVNRLALDQPGASPMPLLRMHTPSESPMLSRETEPSTVETTDSAASATEAPAAQPSVMSSLVRRSAILPSAPSAAAPAESAGATASTMAEISSGALQRSPAADYALPMLQRTSVQRFFGSRPALKLPSLGGIQNSVNSLAGQAQGMVNQVTGMPNQLMGQAQGMVNQVTGMPNQLMGQAQGMIDQVTGMPNQLMGQAQGMIDQVTGLPNQLMGQAQGMIDQVTGLPNQLMGQAQGMIDQVTGMPNQLMGQAQGMIDQVTGMPNQLMGQAQGMIDQVTGMPGQLMGQAQGMIDQVTGMPGQLMGQAQGMLGQVTGMPGQMQDAVSNLAGARSAQLTLLRPVRSESQSAPVKDQDEAQGEATTGSPSSSAASGASGGGAQGTAEAGKQGKPDIDMLAQQVYARLRHRLLIDRERLGR